MSVALRGVARPSWLQVPRRTARFRLTALYSGLFLLSGASLVGVTFVLFERATKYRTPPLPKVPHTPAIENLQRVTPVAVGLPDQLKQFEQQLARDQQQLSLKPSGGVATPLQQELIQDQQQLTRDQQQLAKSVHQLGQAVHQLAQSGSVQAAQRAADAHELLVSSGIALAIVAALALVAGWLVAGRMLRPIRTITRTARRISSTSLHERLALDGPRDELKELGDTLDGLFARLEAAFEAQRHFVANASHELRTPLTAERTLLQVALDDPDTTIADWRSVAREVLASSDEQARLIEALLTLASSESGVTEHQPVDLATSVAATLADRKPEIDRLGLQICEVCESAPLDGDALLVERLVANLLGNAVHHNLPGGKVEVVTGAMQGRAVVSVTNTGPVIPPAGVERLFQPFQRLDQRRATRSDGHGLGLSIVRAIAMAHGAAITAEAQAGGGLCVTVVFPEPERESVRLLRPLT